MKFFVAKVDPQKVSSRHGQAALSPLRFHYDSEQFKLPVRLGLINSGGKQDLIVHILARGKRYEVANYAERHHPHEPRRRGEDRRASSARSTPPSSTRRWRRTPAPSSRSTRGTRARATRAPAPRSTRRTSPRSAPTCSRREPAAQPRAAGYCSRGGGFTLTRLHARYGKETLGADLVFRAAPPIVGRARDVRARRHIEHGAAAVVVQQLPGALRHSPPVDGPHRLRRTRAAASGAARRPASTPTSRRSPRRTSRSRSATASRSRRS